MVKRRKQRMSKTKKGKGREYVETFVIALLIALFVRAFVVQAFKIPSGSMEPTLLVGDHILVNKFIYGIRIPLIGKKLFTLKKPRRGDVIVFIYPLDKSKDFIKRAIGLEGEKVEIKGQKIYINDRLIEDRWGVYRQANSFSGLPIKDNFGPVTVPTGCIFVLGDNRDNSQDSRFWGFVSIEEVLGKAFIIYWSWDWRASSLLNKVRWERIGHLLH
jgi:signal peptidase I